MGTLVDQFATVVRINNYAITGFEKHVGTKEDVWTRSGSDVVLNRIDRTIPTVLWFVPLPAWENKRRISSITERISRLGANHVLLERSHIEKLTQEYFHGRVDVKPSTGLYTVFHYLESHEQIHIHGFDLFDTHKTKMHYFDYSVKKTIKPHDIDFERQIIQNYIDSGRLIKL